MNRIVWAADRLVILITRTQVKYILMTIYYSVWKNAIGNS